MKMEFIKPLRLIDNAFWDSRHLGIVDIDEDIEEIGDVRAKGDDDDDDDVATGAIVDNVGFDWRTVTQRYWNAEAADHLGTIFRYDPGYFRVQWTVERGTPGDSILFEVGGPGTDPADAIGHRTHLEIIENAAGLENATSSMDSVWLPGFTGSSFLDVMEQVRLRVLGIYDPNGDVSVRMSLTLLGGMVVEEAEAWSVPKMVLTRRKRDLPRALTHPGEASPAAAISSMAEAEAPAAEEAPSLDLQALLTPIAAEEAAEEAAEDAAEDAGEAPLAAVDPPAETVAERTAALEEAPPEAAMPMDPGARTESLADALDSLLDVVEPVEDEEVAAEEAPPEGLDDGFAGADGDGSTGDDEAEPPTDPVDGG